ncbi:MAG: hypothetical protein RTU30_06715, partial [Candidatus Thorarchaeota archaeon]
LGRLIRAVPTSVGFTLMVRMMSVENSSILEGDVLSDHSDMYLSAIASDRLDSYFTRRGGLWATAVSIIGHTNDSRALATIRTSIKGALPDPGWTNHSESDLAGQLRAQNPWCAANRFYATGAELSQWLVQLSSELASEVGSNVPGEFIAPIRSRPDDYRLGVTINPETLDTGPMAGISHADLEGGLLLCGGPNGGRRHVLALTVDQLIQAGKRVLVISENSDSLELTSLSLDGLGFVLGQDFVLNPMDSEGVTRNEYVSHLMTALEVLAGSDLRAAADLELALNKTVALGNTTVADVRFSGADEVMSDESATTEAALPSKKSQLGMDAIRILYQGTGARSFYGTQTMELSNLTEVPLSILVLSTGANPLDLFAWDIICSKLTGLSKDKDLVVILDGVPNLRIHDSRYSKRQTWTEQMVKRLKQRGPLVVSLEHPSDLGRGVLGSFTSCIALRLRDSADIAVASDLLGLSVIGGGMHTKARHSSRESSFLRVMESNMALLVHDGSETCQPIRLDDEPEIGEVSDEERRSRHDDVIEQRETIQVDDKPRSLIDTVGGRDRDAALRILRLLKRYEPLTQEAVRRFLQSSGTDDLDVEAVLFRLEQASMILKGHESHSGVSYTNYRITMKGDMSIRQSDVEEGSS